MRRIGAAVLGTLGACAVIGVTTSAFAATSGLHDHGVVYFSTTHSARGKTFAAGNATDKLFGKEAVTYSIKTRTLTTGVFQVIAKPVTTWGKTGTLSGTATATLTVTSPTTATITKGKITEKNGTGAWRGHRFTATFSGTGDPTTGVYKITYKGTFK
jgi:hypothetical protein